MVKNFQVNAQYLETIKGKTNGVDCLKKIKISHDKDTMNKVKSGSYLQNKKWQMNKLFQQIDF